jgi:hypothetical protein
MRQFIVFLGALLLAGGAVAQVPQAMITGRITDANKGVVPGAKVTVTNVGTAIPYSRETDDTGAYTIPLLPPGDYSIEIEKQGFKTIVKPDVTLHVQDNIVLNFELAVGSVTENITVEGTAPAVELLSSTIGGVVDPSTMVDLPLNGRDWTLLAALESGVSTVTTQRPANASQGPRGNRGFGQQMTISGTRPQLNNYRLDGISIVDYAGGSPGSALGIALGVDAVAEFSVLTSNSSAEYGRTAGGVINAITRSGTNQIHGDAYWFLRDEALDAANFFDDFAHLPKPSFHRNQFGASAGGPIQRDKTFFFADYEGIRETLGSSSVGVVPSPGARGGILHNASGTACTIGVASPGCALTYSAGTVGVDPLVIPFLGLFPLPNLGLVGNGDTGLFGIPTNETSSGDFVTARIDRKISESDSVFGSWYYDRALDDQPDALNDVLNGNKTTRWMTALEWTHIFSALLANSLRGGFSRVAALCSVNITAINPLATNPALSAIPPLAAAPVLNIPGTAGFVGGGVGPSTGNDFFWNSFQVYDDATKTMGVHSIKFGFAFERMQENFTINPRPVGQFNFGSLADFLTNAPLQFQSVVPGPNGEIGSRRRVRQSLFGGYLQDDWRVRTNLTLNLGLRYEAVTVPTEVQNKLVNLPTFTSPPPGHLGSPYFSNPTLRNFEPRIGFSWDPFHNGMTAVRGAFGMFDILPLNYEFANAEGESAPFEEVIHVGNLSPGSFPTGAGAAFFGKPIPASSLLTQSIEPNPKRNYLMIWNLNVERQLNPSTSVMVGYVGNHGVHMLNRADDVNDVLPTATPQGLLWPFPAGSGTVLNPAVGRIFGEYWTGTSLFDALEVQVSKRMSHGFQVQGSYTWGKNIDTGSAGTIGDPYTNSISSQFWFCIRCRRGLSDYNIAHTLVVNYLWAVPAPKSLGAIGSNVLGGWNVGGIITAETGVPFTPLIGGDPLGLNNADAFAYPNRLTGPGCGSAVNPGKPLNYINLNCFGLPMASPAIAAQCTPFSAVPGSCSNLLGSEGRNSVIGPGLVNFDFSLFKNTYIPKISERFNVQFRAEFFNVFNRPNFSPPIDNSTLFDQGGNPVGGAGVIDATSTPAREIQFALKLIW